MFFIKESIFSSFNSQQLQDISKSFIRKQYKRGEPIFYEEDLTDGIYLILNGYVKVYQSIWNGREKTLAILSPGDIIGEMATFGKHIRSASVKALEPTEVYYIPQRRFEELLSKAPSFGLKIAEILTCRLRWANRQIALLVSGNSHEKVIGQLVYLAEKCGQPHNGGIIIRPRLTHDDMASLAGVARETVTKVFRKLEKKALITFENRRLVIKDLKSLQNEV
ncbi:MAG: Crp/Fnr family transcriptional regulator [Bacillota bacterium]